MLRKTTLLLLIFFSSPTFSKNFFIYSIEHKLPTGKFGTNEEPQKNFYLNIGSLQGLEKGSIVEVRRKVSKNNKFSNNNEHIFHIRVGLLKIIHVSENSSIGISDRRESESNKPILQYSTVMLGDEVTIPVD